MRYDVPDELWQKAIRHSIELNQLPPVLYRYRAFDEYAEPSLRDGMQMFSNPFAFNDPFDCQLQDSGNHTEEALTRFLVEGGFSPNDAKAIWLQNSKLENKIIRESIRFAQKKWQKKWVFSACLKGPTVF